MLFDPCQSWLSKGDRRSGSCFPCSTLSWPSQGLPSHVSLISPSPFAWCELSPQDEASTAGTQPEKHGINEKTKLGLNIFLNKLSTLNLPVSHGFSSLCWWCVWLRSRKTSRGVWNARSWTLAKASRRRCHWFRSPRFNLYKQTKKKQPFESGHHRSSFIWPPPEL